MFLFNIFAIANHQTITNAQLELSNGVLYPQERMKRNKEVARAYRTLTRYSRQFNYVLSGPTINANIFKELYGILYFDK